MNKKLLLGVVLMATLTITLGTRTMVLPSYAQPKGIDLGPGRAAEAAIEKAPVVISGNNEYIVWFTNEGTVNSNFEVGFRASNDSGATFGPITNLSNTDNSDSINAEIAAENGKIIVSWWEKNQTAMVPVARVSTDHGKTFGPRLNITANPFGTIGAKPE